VHRAAGVLAQSRHRVLGDVAGLWARCSGLAAAGGRGRLWAASLADAHGRQSREGRRAGGAPQEREKGRGKVEGDDDGWEEPGD
jgi:hypothetical protein